MECNDLSTKRHGLQALKYFQKMKLTGFKSDAITFASVISIT